jgi:hypothetical protein
MRNLADRVPAEVRADLAAAVTVLECYGPPVVGALHMLRQRTTDACYAVEMRVASLDPAELAEPTQEEYERMEEALGIDRGWRAAFRVTEVIDG